MQSRDQQIFDHMFDYCEDIEDILKKVNNDPEIFLADKTAQYALAFSILQIGELVSKLSDDLKYETKGIIDWRSIKGMRNIIAHDYGEINLDLVWDVASTDIPALKKFCEEQL